MACKKLSKEDEKLLRGYVSQMPVLMCRTHEVHFLTGKEMTELGHVFQEGETVEEDKKYAYNMPVDIAANHYRRLKRAWLKNGQEGIKQYLQTVANSINQHKAMNNVTS